MLRGLPGVTQHQQWGQPKDSGFPTPLLALLGSDVLTCGGLSSLHEPEASGGFGLSRCLAARGQG